MSGVEEIEKAVSELEPADLRRFREWFDEFTSELWDRQIESDLRSGRLDALIEEARADHGAGRTRPL